MLETSQDQQVAAGAIVEEGAWLGRLHGELRGLLAPVVAQARSRLTAGNDHPLTVAEEISARRLARVQVTGVNLRRSLRAIWAGAADAGRGWQGRPARSAPGSDKIPPRV